MKKNVAVGTAQVAEEADNYPVPHGCFLVVGTQKSLAANGVVAEVVVVALAQGSRWQAAGLGSPSMIRLEFLLSVLTTCS